MANANTIIPFILSWEGGLSKDTTDSASINCCPGTSFHTNKGITWSTWSGLKGQDEKSQKDFIEMTDENWLSIFKPLFWDKICGDNINSQRIAEMLVDFVWSSGIHFPEVRAQHILNVSFGKHLIEDGCFGKSTIEALNSVTEEELFNEIVANRLTYIDQIIVSHPTYVKFEKGWKRRIQALVNFTNGDGANWWKNY